MCNRPKVIFRNSFCFVRFFCNIRDESFDEEDQNCASQVGRPGRSLKSKNKNIENKTETPSRTHRKTRIVRHPKTSRSVVPSFPENVLGNPKNGGTTYQWVVQEAPKISMKMQSMLISINFMVVSVILQIVMVQDLVDPGIRNFRSYSWNRVYFS